MQQAQKSKLNNSYLQNGKEHDAIVFFFCAIFRFREIAGICTFLCLKEKCQKKQTSVPLDRLWVL
ncbi:MAG: hypothetical protein J5860_06255, partial [Clostridia bacterium]|nr:hypothetical protein [Clostridia bacterium]